MKNAFETIINQVLANIRPEENILIKINNIAKDFCFNLEEKLKKNKINAEVFVGGSLAKNTLVKKNKYDIDVFVRFDKKYKDSKISGILGNILEKNAKKIHGSRDYYQLMDNRIIIEVIPVMKIKNPKEAVNVTDFSYFHVNYIAKKISKDKKLPDEIILAKAFAHAQDAYGAESYINGFSGYALELLVCHYGSFLGFIKEIADLSNEKLIIDDARFYKKKQDVLIEMNEAKILNPIILIDPTFKERNALASLSLETLSKFKKSCSEFLKNPSSEFFERKNVFEELNKKFKNLRIVSVKTNKQKGDIAGTKSKKFFNFFVREAGKEFEIKQREFDYDENKNIAYFYFVFDKKGEEIFKGPPITEARGITGFKKAHPEAFIKNGFAYAHVSHKLSFEKFFKKFMKKNKKIIDEMNITEINIKR